VTLIDHATACCRLSTRRSSTAVLPPAGKPLTLRLGESVERIEVAEDADGPGSRSGSTWRAARRSSPRRRCTRSAHRRDAAAGARQMRHRLRRARPARGRRKLPHRRCRASMPWATSSAFRRWPRPRWSRAASRSATVSGQGVQRPGLFPFASTRFPKSRWSQDRGGIDPSRIAYEVGKARYGKSPVSDHRRHHRPSSS